MTPEEAGKASPEIAIVRKDLAELLQLSWPVVLSRLGIMGMGLSDSLVVGRYSAEQLGFHALGWAPTSVVVTMIVGLLSGVQVMTSRAVGRGDLAETGAVLRRGLGYGFWIGLACSALLVVGGPAFLHHLGLAPALADGATRPLIIFSVSMPGYADPSLLRP